MRDLHERLALGNGERVKRRFDPFTNVSRDTIRLVMNRRREQGKLEMLVKGRDAKWQRKEGK